jgi:hypothetical protein
VLAEALEVTARLQLARRLPALRLLERAAALREAIGQPPPPSDITELAALTIQAGAASAASGADAAAPGVDDAAALRSWALDLCWSMGPDHDAPSRVAAG